MKGVLQISEEVKHYNIYLKENSNYYPIIFEDLKEDVTSLSTLVRLELEKDGIWYTVHCVEKAVLNEIVTISTLYQKLIKSTYDIMNLYNITGKFEDLDKVQISEEDRLVRLIG